MKKPKERKRKIIFINAVNEIKLERSAAYLEEKHIKKISTAYRKFQNVDGFAKVVDRDIVLNSNNSNLSVQLYVKQENGNEQHELKDLIESTKKNQTLLNRNIDDLLKQLKTFEIE